jgi:hypothetical protein
MVLEYELELQNLGVETAPLLKLKADEDSSCMRYDAVSTGK